MVRLTKTSSESLGNFNEPKLSASSMTEITEVKDTTTIKNIFAKNAELSNALI